MRIPCLSVQGTWFLSTNVHMGSTKMHKLLASFRSPNFFPIGMQSLIM